MTDRGRAARRALVHCGTALVALLAPLLLAAAPASAQECLQEAMLKSLPGGMATEVTFRNVSDSPRRLYWVDDKGVRKFYAVVEPGKLHRQPTFDAHAWVVTDASEQCQSVIIASAAPMLVDIGGKVPAVARPVTPPPIVKPAKAPVTDKSDDPPRKPRHDPADDCSKNQVYSEKRGKCISKATTCSRHQVYSSSLHECIAKSSTCGKNEVYSSSVAECIPKDKPNKPGKPPACKYKTDGAGNCLSPSHLKCQSDWAACVKNCGNKSCKNACEKRYSGQCGD